MKAYHGDLAIKARYLGRVRAHAAADEIIKGQYWQHGRGCAVGCTIHGSDHGAYEIELGIPQILARLEDVIFEGLPNKAAKRWPASFLEAIPVGADLSLVWPRFAVWLLTDSENGVLRLARADKSQAEIRAVADAYSRVIAGEVCEIDWVTLSAGDNCYAADAAYAAAADAYAYAYAHSYAGASTASDAAGYAAAAYAASACAYAHSYAAASAAYAAASAGYAARTAAYAASTAAYAAASAGYAARTAARTAALTAAAAASARTAACTKQAYKLLTLLREAL